MITRGRTIAGALALCALAAGVVGAAGASAVGLTAVKCVKQEKGKYKNSHCSTSELGTEFETVAIEGSTEVEGTSTEAEPKLTATITGLNVIIKCETTHVTPVATVTNVKVGEEMKIHGTNAKLTYTNCGAILKSNEAKVCETEEVTVMKEGETPQKGMISTVPLTSTTTGVEHKVKVSPEAGEIFAKFKILAAPRAPATECWTKTAIPVEVTGSVEGEISTEKHSHVTFVGDEAHNGGLLKANGVKAFYHDTVGGYMSGEPETTVGAETF